MTPRSRPEAVGRGAWGEGGLAVKADRNAVETVADRHERGDIMRWVSSTALAVVVVALLLLIGMVL